VFEKPRSNSAHQIKKSKNQKKGFGPTVLKKKDIMNERRATYLKQASTVTPTDPSIEMEGALRNHSKYEIQCCPLSL
jgi:hypothetical protein